MPKGKREAREIEKKKGKGSNKDHNHCEAGE